MPQGCFIFILSQGLNRAPSCVALGIKPAFASTPHIPLGMRMNFRTGKHTESAPKGEKETEVKSLLLSRLNLYLKASQAIELSRINRLTRN